jgi:hypothetical protein
MNNTRIAALGRLCGVAIGKAIHARHKKDPLVCRFCGEPDVILVSDDKGISCMPCFRLREALAELEKEG